MAAKARSGLARNDSLKIEQQFIVSRPLPVVWAFFHDIPKVAACMPGAEYLGQTPEGKYLGKVTTKVGPFQTSFEGEAEVTFDEDLKQVTSAGKGVDKKGASRGKMTLLCRVEPEGQATKVSVDADVQLSGSIAQFGRTGLITEVANVLIASFVQHAEAALAVQSGAPEPTPDAPAPAPLGALGLFAAVLKGWFARLFPGKDQAPGP